MILRSREALAPLALRSLSVGYRGVPALWDVSWEAREGALTAIVGPNGAGKSTLLNAAIGALRPLAGETFFWGQSFADARSRVAYVPQRESVDWDFPVTALEVVEMGAARRFDWLLPAWARRGEAHRRHRMEAHSCLDELGLGAFADRPIGQLSGGQQQRVALARSLVKEANIVLLDEPLVNLDYKLREQLREEFRNIFSAKASENSILIYSSTDPVEAMQLGGQILVMDEGRILQQDSAKEVYENPNSTKVSQITNDPAMNLFEGTVADGKIILSSEIQFDLPQHCQALPQGPYTFGLRAAAISLAEGGFPFTVELSEISGSETFLHLKHEHVQVVGLLDSVQNFNIGETVTAQFDTAHLYAFATDGRLKSSPYGGLK